MPLVLVSEVFARPSTGDTLRDIISKATAAGPGHMRVDSYLERLLSPVGKPYFEVWVSRIFAEQANTSPLYACETYGITAENLIVAYGGKPQIYTITR
ncbi:hypothetical protein N7534_003598 [Penicillium rubens]|nr:hypothetical protein N7534_003598 [Penicillium rubens]